MAIGISGSNGGISQVYREISIVDIEAGLRKYKNLFESAPMSVKPLYEIIVRDLDSLHSRLKERALEKNVRAA
ncbi:MAG: hypothetical protein WC613_05360 [Candidatus Aenigmatarchaeota archaeon]